MSAYTFVARRSFLHPGKEWDPYTRSWVRRGWVAERQSLQDAEYRRFLNGTATGGTCTGCGLPIFDHPMPDRNWRSGPDLCAVAIAKESEAS